jgi:hypothetical protein
MSVIRVARAFTKRDDILKFEGCYHGHADYLLAKAGSGVATLGLPDSPGVPADFTKHTLTAPYNDLAAVREVFAALFELDAEAAIDIDVDAIRPLRDDVAMVDGISRVSYSDGDVAGSRFSAVVIREDDHWRLASVRETAAAVEPKPARPLDQLAWLVGSWEDVGDGVIASSQAAWSADRGFLVRTHVSTPDDHPAGRPAAGDSGIPGLLPAAAGGRRELTEIIGWDPDRETIRSWLFSADGRFAEGTWSREAGGWTVKLEGHGRDAGRTATCTLTAEGADGLVLRCEGEGLEGLLPPACGYARTAR